VNDPESYRELLAINRAIASATDYDEVLQRVVDCTVAVTRADACLLLLAQGDGRAHIARAVGVDLEKAAGFAFALNERIDRELCSLLGFQPEDEFIGVPVMARGALLGVLAIYRRGSRKDADSANDTFVVSALADQAAIALDNAQRLRQGEALLGALFENAPLGFATFDNHMRFVRVNPALARMNGVPGDAHIGKTPFEMLPGVPGEQIAALFRLVLDNGQPVVDFELSGETAASPGKTRHWSETCFPIVAGGETLGVGAIVREITAEKEAEEFRANVLGIVGHDLRNPLSAISSAAAILAKQSIPDDFRARTVARIATTARRMARIIDDLLDFTRAGSGHSIPIELQPTDIADVCATVLEEMEAARPPGGFHVEGTGDGRGEWDPYRLAQALGNLVANAVKYCSPEEPVRLRWEGREAEVLIEVHNYGKPIPPELMPALFRPFRQAAQTTSREGGLGLGLFIARQIVVALSGEISVRSDASAGTTFTIALPRRPPTPR
jgi:PAS domain S-box-containing protein